jgi:hypothetical protein
MNFHSFTCFDITRAILFSTEYMYSSLTVLFLKNNTYIWSNLIQIYRKKYGDLWGAVLLLILSLISVLFG